MHALFLQGLALVEAKGVAPVALDEFTERVEYWVRPIELDRLERLPWAQGAFFTPRSLERLYGAVISLALPDAELSESFALEVLAAGRPRAPLNIGTNREMES